jgi:hypothetical protein
VTNLVSDRNGWTGQRGSPRTGRASPSPCSAAFLRLAVALCFLWPASFGASAATVTASLDRNRISAGESTTLSITVEGGEPTGTPNVPAVPNLRFDVAGTSRQMSVLNFKVNSSLTYNYRITAAVPGDYSIPAVQVPLPNEVLTTQPLRLTVAPATAPPAADARSQMAFLELKILKDSVYVGEVFPIEIQLYVTAGESLQMMPLQSEGFVIGNMPQPTQSRQELNGTVYHVVSYRLSAQAVKTGRLNLGPAQCHLTLHVPVENRDRFGLFGSRVIRQPASLSSESREIEVRPLPVAGRPTSFSGAVGNFEWIIEAHPTNVMAGDPITVQVQISGEGSLDSVQVPQFAWPGFRSYPPTVKTDITDPLGMAGVKTFEQVVIPQKSELVEMPALSFSFFDPRTSTYRHLEHPPIGIRVAPARPAAFAGREMGARPVDEAPDEADPVMRHIKPSLGNIRAVSGPLVERPWFLAVQSLPLLLWASALMWRKRQEYIEAHPVWQRQRQAQAAAPQELAGIEELAQQGDSPAFFARAFRLLQDQLGARFDRPSGSITEAQAEELLAQAGADESLRSDVRNLFDACNAARYAQDQTRGQLQDHLPVLRRVIEKLQALPGGGRR